MRGFQSYRLGSCNYLFNATIFWIKKVAVQAVVQELQKALDEARGAVQHRDRACMHARACAWVNVVVYVCTRACVHVVVFTYARVRPPVCMFMLSQCYDGSIHLYTHAYVHASTISTHMSKHVFIRIRLSYAWL